MPVSAAGLHWHTTQYLFKYLFADARKRNMSIYLACHGYTEIDGRIFRYKVPWKFYMKGASIDRDSELWRNAAKLELHNPGDFFCEGASGWGRGHFSKLNIENLSIEFNKPTEKDNIYTDYVGEVETSTTPLKV
jgi:hypothetical protein